MPATGKRRASPRACFQLWPASVRPAGSPVAWGVAAALALPSRAVAASGSYSVVLKPGLSALDVRTRLAHLRHVEPDAPMQAATQTVLFDITRVGGLLSSTAKIDGIDERINLDVAVRDTGLDLTPRAVCEDPAPACSGGK